MNIALYARYSSEGQREASVTDQFRNCERWAAREDGTITHRYQDQGISGSMDARQRPGYRALLEDAKVKRFDVVLVDDLSRLSRDEAELILTRRKLTFHGVRLVGVSDGFDSAAKGHKIQATVRGMMNEMFLDDLKEKTHRGLTGQALKGHHTGGRTYGYRHVPQEHPTKTDAFGRPEIIAVTREPEPEQARWVLEIFEWYAAGQSPRWIAGELNRLKVAAPSVGWRRRAPNPTWSASSLHGDPKQYTGLLHNPIYIGRVVWNRR
jgi:DNA invertase Pin-like site-specific DNA recombinase